MNYLGSVSTMHDFNEVDATILYDYPAIVDGWLKKWIILDVRSDGMVKEIAFKQAEGFPRLQLHDHLLRDSFHIFGKSKI